MLVSPLPYLLNLQLPREGIRYTNMSEEEIEQWDDLDWDENGEVPDRPNAEAVNR